jgi:hypothetical protein
MELAEEAAVSSSAMPQAAHETLPAGRAGDNKKSPDGYGAASASGRQWLLG